MDCGIPATQSAVGKITEDKGITNDVLVGEAARSAHDPLTPSSILTIAAPVLGGDNGDFINATGGRSVRLALQEAS